MMIAINEAIKLDLNSQFGLKEEGDEEEEDLPF